MENPDQGLSCRGFAVERSAMDSATVTPMPISG